MYTGVSSVDWQDTYVSVITLVLILNTIINLYLFLFYSFIYCRGLSAPLDMAYETEAGFVFDKTDNEISLSSLVPIIFYDETAICGLRGVFGTDDSIIVGQILYNILLRSLNISIAVEYPRYSLIII